ncbi:efflux RND transporter periplasmic adaptor subunit [Rhodocytophaga rosea]|uniref:Efflux RND transporter periplasmic adaptor subunit n=1 Tax=Rhodocytophaga rosea TaxID=2704465 RepID=A0A6C0GVB0_9BACT|nr:efflux RND transporter periplasmic adaptor subunit [Rhodocytophaga rosea]QHT71272.1 efflux RND transporter periplasmic adaptor subunit [Rhodocytophaga rosea]
MKKIVIVVIVLALSALVAFRLISNKKEIDSKNKMPDNSSVRVSVNVVPVQSRVSEQNLSMVGTVAANQVIDIKSEVQGKITSLNIELGNYVKKGQVIARIDDQIRRISLSNAEQKLADARQNLERYKNLLEGGAATQAQFEQYKLSYENAENALAQAKKELSNTTIAAPISGYITQKVVESGAFANVGNSIATIVDVSKLKVQLNVAENDVYALKVGDPVSITSTVYPGVTFKGEITFISPSGDAAHNYPVEISFVNQAKNELKAGTYVNIAFNRKSQVPSLQIPRESLVGSLKDAQVYVVNNNNIAQLRKITIGADNGAFLDVLEGLKEGEKVVTTGQINLTDSTLVSVIK